MKSFEERQIAAAEFAKEWHGRGQEIQDDRVFWIEFLQEVMGVDRATHAIEFQKPVNIIGKPGTGGIDAYIPSSKVLIEQKSLGIDLDASQPGHDGLTPYEQARRYARDGDLLRSEEPDWIIVSDFANFRIYDCRENYNQEPIIVALEDLPDRLYVFKFLTEDIKEKIRIEEEVNQEAAERIDKLYGWMKKGYDDPEAARHELSILMVRILFCLYAEDSGLFDKDLFTNYLMGADKAGLSALRNALKGIFMVLSTSPEARKGNLDIDEALAQFPYVNGGLFEGEIRMPRFSEEIRLELLLCGGFDWSGISPVIFGSIFEGILSGDERRAGGMHYTSVTNIHKVIDPLFLDGLHEELSEAGSNKETLLALQEKMAGLKFLDPACGSGNFLTQTYIDLRNMENNILRRLHAEDQTGNAYEVASFIKVNVGQFYGIEINDFAVAVAQTALWIADHQANKETSQILGHVYKNLPLQKLDNIRCENALRVDWSELLPAGECSYIMGNPPFVGAANRSEKQTADMALVFIDETKWRACDYCVAWYREASSYMKGTTIKAALVSTNSICQGEQVEPTWKHLLDGGIIINFAWRPFVWDNEAHVHCVIVGFSYQRISPCKIFDDSGSAEANNINGYLADAPNVVISSRSKPICIVPKTNKGSSPTDDGNLVISNRRDYERILEKNPGIEKYIHPYYGADEFLNGIERWCFWLEDLNLADLKHMPILRERIEKCREYRASRTRPQTKRAAETPHLFVERRQPTTDYLMIPRHSSERRKWIPFGFLESDIIASDAAQVIPDADLYLFGVLSSSVHNAWMRAVAGRLKSDYRYSVDIVYNNFIWPDPTAGQKSGITQSAQAVLEARASHPEVTLAGLYDPNNDYLFPDLMAAHKELDSAVERAYGGDFKGDEEKIVAHLFELYAAATQDEQI